MRVQRRIDPWQHLAFAITDAQFDGILLFDRGAVVGIRFRLAVAQVVDGHRGVVDQVLALLAQQVTKESQLFGIHVGAGRHRQQGLFGEWFGRGSHRMFPCFPVRPQLAASRYSIERSDRRQGICYAADLTLMVA